VEAKMSEHRMAWAALVAAMLTLGCRSLERHTSDDKPKVKNRATTVLEAGTNLFPEGQGPNRHDPRRPSSPYESVSLKWRVEYGVEW
jgi:hypothetical protein